MADGRMLKRVISTSPRLARLKNDTHRLIYTWLIPWLDVDGRHEADARIVKGHVAPLLDHITTRVVETALLDMHEHGLVILYSVNGNNYLQLERWAKHQRLRADREAKSDFPAPDSRSTPGVLPDNSRSTPTQDKLKEDKIYSGMRGSNPSLDEVVAYCRERNNQVDPQLWYSHYEANGWRVGRNQMRNWRAAVRTWERSNFTGGNNGQTRHNSNTTGGHRIPDWPGTEQPQESPASRKAGIRALQSIRDQIEAHQAEE